MTQKLALLTLIQKSTASDMAKSLLDGVVDKCVTFAGGKNFPLALTHSVFIFHRKLVSCVNEKKFFLLHYVRSLGFLLMHYFFFLYLVLLHDWHYNFCQLKLLVAQSIFLRVTLRKRPTGFIACRQQFFLLPSQRRKEKSLLSNLGGEISLLFEIVLCHLLN